MLDHAVIAERRRVAADACRLRFGGKPYETGTRDCVRLVAHDLHKLGVKVPFLKGLRWNADGEESPDAPTARTMAALDGARHLRKLGFETLIEAVDALGLPRIPVARAMAADIIALPTTHRLGALGVFMGNRNVLGYHEDSPNAEVFELREAVCAWRAIGG